MSENFIDRSDKEYVTKKYVGLYEEGSITDYELFSVLRGKKLDIPEKYRYDYDEWMKNHPVGNKVNTFSIFA